MQVDYYCMANNRTESPDIARPFGQFVADRMGDGNAVWQRLPRPGKHSSGLLSMGLSSGRIEDLNRLSVTPLRAQRTPSTGELVPKSC